VEILKRADSGHSSGKENIKARIHESQAQRKYPCRGFLNLLLIQYNNGVFKGIFVDNLQVGEAASIGSL
jgi:hypothetical protein